MKLSRRIFLHLTAGAGALPALSSIAGAQAYPTRPVKIIVTFPPGGSNDIHGRLHGQWLSERLGQPFIIENKPGGGGNIGTAEAARAAPDGHTILYLSISLGINIAAYEKLSHNIVSDITPVASIFRANYVMLVNPSFPVRTLPDFIRYARANPHKLNLGSQGVGATGHLAGEWFKQLTGTDLLHVPYRGETQALTDLMSGQIQVQFATSTSAIPLVKEGKLRALAVTSDKRSAALPEVPIMQEYIPGYEFAGWTGVGVPKGTSASIVNLLNAEINASLARPEIHARYADLGLDPYPQSPADFAKYIAEDVEKWQAIVKTAGVKLD